MFKKKEIYTDKFIVSFDGIYVENGIVKFKPDLVRKTVACQDYSDFPEHMTPETPGIISGAY
jgi:hypothetical protein